MDDLVKYSMIFSAVFLPFIFIQLLLAFKNYIYKEKGILDLEEEYEKANDARNEFINHYYWSIHSNEKEDIPYLKKAIVK